MRCLLRLFGLLLVASCSASIDQPRAPDAAVAARLGADAPLMPFFAALSQRDAGAANVIPVLQLGDSHTAADMFSGRLRELLQSRFGDAGRGLLPPGVPYRHYHPARVAVTARGWTAIPSAGPRARGPFGLTGVRQHTDRPAVMTLAAPERGDLDTVEFEFLRQPGGGTIALGQPNAAPVSTNGLPDVAWAAAPRDADRIEFTVRANGDGPVDLLAWNAGRGTPGVTYSNLGTIGASITLLDRWDDSIVRSELAHLSPKLIVIAFGTNEGFADTTDPERYGTTFANRLRALKAAAPGAALLVIGPPDGARHRRKGETGDCGDPNWVTPPRLASVRAAQRLVAKREGALFWDWQAAMGGACSMQRWASASPPLAARDHIHLLTAGYRKSADALFGAIMEGYEQYRIANGLPARPAS